MSEAPEYEKSHALRSKLEAQIGPLHSLRPVTGGGAQGAKVWLGVLASGKQVAVKQHKYAGAGEIEFGVLEMLYRLGAPVARPLHWQPELRVLITEWIGSRTLAAAIHEADQRQDSQSHDLRRMSYSLLQGCIALETAFQGLAARMPLSKTGEQQRRHAEVRARCRQAPETFARLAAYCDLTMPQGWTSALREAWAVVADSLCAGRTTFGGRDCTPLNVLIGGPEIWFVDFAVVGLDWPEARLAQYAAAVAAGAPTQPLQSLLTHGEVQWYVDSGCIESPQLDMHHLLLWSEVLRLLLDGKMGMPKPQGKLLDQRLDQALKLALSPLAPTTPGEFVRSLVATIFVHGSFS